MKVTKLNCTACGAPISVPDDLDFINCSSCGSFLGIERGEGYVALKVAEKIARAIEDSGKGTQDVIRENTQVTRSELQRLQMTQEISSAQMQLSNIQAEIRGLERAQQNAKTASQMKALRFTEYQAMDRIRQLDVQYSAPASDNLLACAEFAEREIGWIDSEINVLNQSNSPQRIQIAQSLNNHKQELRGKAYDLRVRELKSRFPSFKVKDLPLNDQAQVAALLAQIAQDEKSLRSSRGTPAGNAVHQEILNREYALKQAWTKMEQERINGRLSATSYQANRGDVASLNEYLNRIEQDLVALGDPSGNPVAQDFQRRLLEEQRRTQKQIRSLEKQAEKTAQRAAQGSQPRGEGFFAILLAGFAALFAGIAALFSSLFAGRSVSPQATSTAWPVSQPDEKNALETGVPPVSLTTGKPELKSVGIGCLLGLLLMAAVSTIGLIVLMIAFPDTSHTGGTTVGGLFLSTAVGLGVGSWVFMRRAAPNTTIRGFGKLPTINIARGKPRNGLNNPLAVKGLVGIITCLIIWSLFLALAGYTTMPGSSLPAILVLVGFVLGPVLAAIGAARADFQKDQV